MVFWLINVKYAYNEVDYPHKNFEEIDLIAIFAEKLQN